MDYTTNLYELNIDNATLQIGIAVRYFAYQYSENKSRTAVVGRLWKSEAKVEDTYELYLPFGYSMITYEGDRYQIKVTKTGEAIDHLCNTYMHPFEITMALVETEEMKYCDDAYFQYKKEKVDVFQDKVKKFIADAQVYYSTHITEVEDKSGVVGIYIFDEYWELLNRHQPRKIDTVCLDGKEGEILNYIKKFKSPQVKKRYLETGTPYKKNIMFEGFPGTGKTSLIFSLASELDCNIAIINFSKDMDDNNFMRAIRRLPKNCMLVLEDIDVLFKERKENDGYKSSLSFSALLNTLDGLAFRQGTITVMTTNYLCNLDSALKRPGRIDKIIHFGLATENQVRHMFGKFFPEKVDEFDEFYQKIRSCKFTTAILQQYFLWHMEEYEGVMSNIKEFKKLCSEHNYESNRNLYS
jgi:hypothetical protein